MLPALKPCPRTAPTPYLMSSSFSWYNALKYSTRSSTCKHPAQCSVPTVAARPYRSRTQTCGQLCKQQFISPSSGCWATTAAFGPTTGKPPAHLHLPCIGVCMLVPSHQQFLWNANHLALLHPIDCHALAVSSFYALAGLAEVSPVAVAGRPHRMHPSQDTPSGPSLPSRPP